MIKAKSTATAVAEQLARLRDEYLTRLPVELAALQTLAGNLSGGEIDRAHLNELHHRLHKLAGSGGTFGLPLLSTNARALENRVKNWLSGSLDAIDAPARKTLAQAVTALTECVTEFQPHASAMPAGATAPEHGNNIHLWLVEDDTLLAQELARQLESFNYEVRLFERIADAERSAQSERPDLLILDIILQQEGLNSTAALASCPNLREMDCPMLFISSFDDFQSRVRASQLRAEGYFLKPLDVPRLANRIVQVLEKRHAAPQRVLIVEDDLNLAAHYRLVLLGSGMEADVLHEPEAIIEKVSAFRPELVLMDMNMPGYSGADIAGVIRQHDNWASLPIVYLSGETDLARQMDALDRGADDFLVKPISDAQLVAAVRVRIERARQLNAHISKDSLTGLLKHASIKESVDVEVIRAQRGGKAVTVAMLDIDHFKAVNDNYGHAVGDVVISSVAMLLRQRLRQSDIAGRYGGEEFVALMPECLVDDARRVLEDIRQRFAAVRFSHDGKEFHCTLSAGLACSAQYPDSSGAELLIAADEALYAAKHGGRNQVRVAGESG